MNTFKTITTDRSLLRRLEITDSDDCIYALLEEEWKV